MKNSKGFTLVELLSTIAILAIVLGIVSAAYVGITNHIKASFYKTLEESILVSGGEYYAYTKERPEMFGDEKKISLKNLVENKYLTDIVDRKGNQCNLDTSYVGAYKDNYDKTNYYVCLTCDSDDYKSDKTECSSNIDYSLQMIATVNNTNKIYQVNNWVNNHVKLSFKTLNNINTIYVKDNSLGTSYNCTMSGNNIKTCSINIDKSGNYEYYGVSNDNKETKHGYINILVDKIKPSFDIYEGTTEITSDTITKNINSDSINININNIVRNIVDLDSKVQSIRYSFEKEGSNKNYITIDNNLTEFNINKTLGLGKYELIIEIKDYAGNINKRTIVYQNNKIVLAPDSSYCNNLTYNGLEQVLTKEAGEGYIFVNNKGKNAGNYEVTANLKENYSFGEGRTSVKFTCSIKRQSTATMGSCQDVTYNGYEQVIARGGTNVTYSNNLKTDAGTYPVTITANSNYAFTDNSTTKTLNCTLNKKSVSVNWGNTTFTYNGNQQAPTVSATSGVSGETLNITRTTATNAGNYTSTASISSVSGGRANKNNYSLTGNTKAFTINKANPTVTLSATSGSVDVGSTLTFTEKANIAGSFSNSSSNTSIATINPTNYSNVSANTNKTVTITGISNGTSTITVTFIPNDTTNYNNKTETYTITGYKIASTGSCNNLTYNGSSQTLVSGGVGVNYSNNSRANQGSQTVTISLQSGYRWSDSTTANKTLNCTINKKTISITAKNQNLNGTNTIDKSINQITTSRLLSGHNVTSINLTQSTTSDTTNGTITPSNAVIKSGTTDVTSNYSITYNKGNLTIVTVEYCANFYLNGASKIDGVASDKFDVCCSPGNNTSCTISSPTITPATDFDVLGWNTNSEATTSNYNSGASISLSQDDNQFYAITRSKSSTRKTKYLNFKLNGATAYTYNGTRYTNDHRTSCLTDYAYNGDEIPDFCSITLPTIERTGGNAYGWDEDNNAQSATYNQGANYSIYDEITLNAITSKTITLTLDPNGGTTTIAPIIGKAYNLDTGASFIIPSYNNANMCRTGINYTKFSKGSFAADGYLNAYKYIGLTDDQSSNTVKYCQGNYLYLEEDTTLYAIWNIDYATTKVTSGDNLNLRKGCGTRYGLTGASMNDSKTIYISKEGSAYSSGYMGYWVKYGSREGCASSMYLRNFTYPIYNSCNRTDYVCNGGTAADVTLTPSVVTLNLKKSDMLSKTINIDNRCGNITSTRSSNTSIATVSRAGNVITVTAVPGSVPENESKTATVTVRTEWDCSASTDVIVKNTNAVAPTVDISISGDSSTCSGSYIKGATATIKCSSNLVPITSFNSTGTTPTGDNYNQTSTVSLSTTGTKTITATCTNSEGSTTASKTVTIKVKSVSSSCSCKTYSTKTVYGSWSGYTCKNPRPSSTSTKEWSCQKDPEASFCSSSKYYKCRSRTISQSTYCSARNSCCHT